VGWFLEWIRGFGTVVFINHLHVYPGDGNLGEGSGGRTVGPRLLRAATPPAVRQQPLRIVLAPNKRDARPSEMFASGARAHQREGWRSVIRNLEAPRSGNR